ncbi:thioredoxin family protein [Anaeromyxobacter paludicola]|uniref:Thioredoxin n=1 Tax=Anaeromyxobacter paludicola TaxID=2918171 RepID=A0ABN6N5K7_9BACT|nr:thiol reductase thioredoxin [Anaeromyxobacter paludicola]BDG08301.1 hypothetical protein AMPC_14140 [Anaeromyxobacter paludicola]
MPVFRCTACGAVNRVGSPAGGSECARCKRALDVSGAPQEVDAASLVSALRSSPAPVLVDFSAGEAPAELRRIARDQAGDLLVLTVDPGAEPAAARAYDVERSPTFILFSRGAEVRRAEALPPEGELLRWCEAPARPTQAARAG